MKIDADAKETARADALADHTAELDALRAILQNLLLEVAREAGADGLQALRDGALSALPATSEARDQSAAIVQATFDLVAHEAGFDGNAKRRDLH